MRVRGGRVENGGDAAGRAAHLQFRSPSFFRGSRGPSALTGIYVMGCLRGVFPGGRRKRIRPDGRDGATLSTGRLLMQPRVRAPDVVRLRPCFASSRKTLGGPALRRPCVVGPRFEQESFRVYHLQGFFLERAVFTRGGRSAFRDHCRPQKGWQRHFFGSRGRVAGLGRQGAVKLLGRVLRGGRGAEPEINELAFSALPAANTMRLARDLFSPPSQNSDSFEEVCGTDSIIPRVARDDHWASKQFPHDSTCAKKGTALCHPALLLTFRPGVFGRSFPAKNVRRFSRTKW